LYYIEVIGCDIENAIFKSGPSTTFLRGEIGAIFRDVIS
jgi:hypothetical protein